MFADANPALTLAEHRSTLPSPALKSVNLLEYAPTKNGSVSSLECALIKSLTLKCFRMRTYEKRVGGYPLCTQLLLSGGSLLSRPARHRPPRRTRHTHTTLRHAAGGPVLSPARRSCYVVVAASQIAHPTRGIGTGTPPVCRGASLGSAQAQRASRGTHSTRGENP
jgi:hypothetical protein